MDTAKPVNALFVVVMVAFICSILVSAATVGLRPIQERNALVERSRNLVALSGLVEAGASLSRDEILEAVGQMDKRVIDIDTGEFVDNINPDEFDPRAAVLDPKLGTDIPAELDVAKLGRRSRYEIVYIAWEDNDIKRIILPIVGRGMWSTLYGYIALENDYSTIGAVTFYEQTETAGIGDRITDPEWQAGWQGRMLFGNDGNYVFRVAVGPATRNTEVDGISGATVTASSVSRLVQYWFGPNGYAAFLESLRNQPPQRLTQQGGDDA